MRKLTLNHQTTINEVATIHEHLLENQEFNYKATQTSIALRYEMINARLRHANDIILLLENYQEIKGFIWGHYESQAKTVIIELLYVYPHYRRQGLAKQLKMAIEQWAEDIGATSIQSTIHINNEAILNLNRQLGYDDTHIRMRKDLM
ncbi:MULTISPECIES: GNAT family N-acetyltransferase [Staphylococcus]|uniref:GNAT family N-acetyltransferase n=1 Tax=Staphylococcus TaxID=1279 RepID=UPI000246394C|nr:MULTISPECIES: GNAT family N-acetyltransferase [Staphylococcus]AGZ26060.1 GNAT family acetyltransferase [Staphylococcus pasteuri SP1]KAB7646790.1 GNAT family N-acetyltransferase [Staphylococcus sp. B2-b]MBN6853601.1 GNAT family N-acetyltransferase [Staphylococcus warneri]MBT2768776.1 GNAT family N-acetyltransferase [Staphylococcus warneri]MBX7839775.1 GNAT family N-acetyltransferase [Staphylococcus warneri]